MSIKAQTPYTCEGQVWLIDQDNNDLLQMKIGSNNGIALTEVKDNLGEQIFALGFRTTDQMLYGINAVNGQLYRIDATGSIEIIAQANVDLSLDYLAGEVTPNGREFIIIGSMTGIDQKLVSINLASGNYEVTEIELENETATVDIGFDPIDGTMYGFDAISRSFYTQALNSPNINSFAPIFFEHNVSGFYFDAFGKMYGLGTALFGTISALFEINQLNGETTLLATSGLFGIADVTGCPYSLEIDNAISPFSAFPCSDLNFEYHFANQTGSTINNVLLEHELPAGYVFVNPDNIPFGGVLDNTTADNILRIENLSIPQGIHSYNVDAYVDDIPAGNYKSQAKLSNVPNNYGSIVNSNDPASYATEDSTRMVVTRFEEDSLSFETFLCQGNALTLSGSDYGNNITWSTGETSQEIEVNETGLFTLSAVSGCEELFVSYEIVAASCPYTIEVGHLIEPDTIFGCSETTFRYILENTSGEDRYNLTLTDTLPLGFSFVEILTNPYDSELSLNLDPNIFQLENIHLPQGVDTISILVESGDFPPSTMGNKVILNGLPELLGPIRNSDNPMTQTYLDSTFVTIKGVEGTSLQVDTFICEGQELLLDASLYGEKFIWDDGSINNDFIVFESGEYNVEVVSGCDSALVTFVVQEGNNIDVLFAEADKKIKQSETIQLTPIIENDGSSLEVMWNDLSSNSLSCYECINPDASPLNDLIYTIHVKNEYCTDSAFIEVLVDEERYIYVPNIFSPNGDGFNDYFYLQSPYEAKILSLSIFDRWGNLLFETKDSELNNESSGWNGISARQKVEPGVYVWHATIEFIDGKKESWSGDLTLMY